MNVVIIVLVVGALAVLIFKRFLYRLSDISVKSSVSVLNRKYFLPSENKYEYLDNM